MTDIRMALLNPPPALVVLERAVPSVKSEQPKVLVNVVATFLVSLFTAFSMVLLIPGFKKV
jgi:capsular polysaccharide biosynthesis protein